jgi:tRNA(Ile)-lysidine synthase
MPLLPFEQRLAEAWPPSDWRDVPVLVGVSGGPDSVALLRGLARLGSHSPSESATLAGDRIIVAHFNHRLRPEADDDEIFVRELAARLNMPYETFRADPAAFDLRDGLESAARHARYRFLKSTAEQLGARYVAVAHTADDQAETILHHIIRGTGLAGLAGMPRARQLSPAVTLIRPLLAVRRAEVMEYLVQLGQTYRIDATNRSLAPTRNRIRLELLPLLAERFNPNVQEAVLRLGALAGEAHEVIACLANDLAELAVKETQSGVTVDCRRLAGATPYVVREMFSQIWRQHGWPLQDMTYRHWDELAAMTLAAGRGERPARVFPGEVMAQADNQELRLACSSHSTPAAAEQPGC